jgi:beta-lactamase class D OXA-2
VSWWVAALPSLVVAGAAVASDGLRDRPDWAAHFARHGVTGTLVVIDERQAPPVGFVYDRERSARRYSPASTFKIPHTLFALDAGAVADEFEVFAWDGVKRSFAGHNQDQNLRSAMRNSTLWVYQGFAKRIGETDARAYLRKIDYGNADPSAGRGDYWVDGNLRISAIEQATFLRKLHRNALPFKVEHQRLVKDLIVTQATPDWILRGKTGWEGSYGWWVGWVEYQEGAVFFALNIDTPRRLADLPARQKVVGDVLRSMGLLRYD